MCEGEVHNCCLKIYRVFYFSNVQWDHNSVANGSGIEGEHCNVDAAPGSYVMATIVLTVLISPVVVWCLLCYVRFCKMSWLV